MLPYLGKRSLQEWLKQGSWDGGIILDISAKSYMHLHAALPEGETERHEDAALKTRVRQSQATECWQPPEAIRGKDWILPLSLQREYHSADILILASATDFRLLASKTVVLRHQISGCSSSPKELIQLPTGIAWGALPTYISLFNLLPTRWLLWSLVYKWDKDWQILETYPQLAWGRVKERAQVCLLTSGNSEQRRGKYPRWFLRLLPATWSQE